MLQRGHSFVYNSQILTNVHEYDLMLCIEYFEREKNMLGHTAGSQNGIAESLDAAGDTSSLSIALLACLAVAVIAFSIVFVKEMRESGEIVGSFIIGGTTGLVGFALTFLISLFIGGTQDTAKWNDVEDRVLENIEENVHMSDITIVETNHDGKSYYTEDNGYIVTIHGVDSENMKTELTLAYDEELDVMMPIRTVDSLENVPLVDGSSLASILNSESTG